MSGWPRLLVITDLGVLPAPQLLSRLELLAERAAPGALGILLRDHAASAKVRFDLGKALRALTRATGQQLWVADRLDLAKLLAADVLHLGEASVTANDARALLGAASRISRAWHPGAKGAAEQVSAVEGVDALVVSPVLAERKGRPPLGLAQLRALGEQLRARHPAYPLFALGGITAETAAACFAAGATGVAAIGAALTGDADALLAASGA
jgi:thiamine-phosphate pyrophosphorylase